MSYIVLDPCHFHRSKFRPTKKFMESVKSGVPVQIGKYENLISLTQYGDGEYPAYRHSRAKDQCTGLYPFANIGVDAGMIALIKIDDSMKQFSHKTIIAEQPYYKSRLHNNGVISFYNGIHSETIYIDTGEIYADLRLARMRKLISVV